MSDIWVIAGVSAVLTLIFTLLFPIVDPYFVTAEYEVFPPVKESLQSRVKICVQALGFLHEENVNIIMQYLPENADSLDNESLMNCVSMVATAHSEDLV